MQNNYMEGSGRATIKQVAKRATIAHLSTSQVSKNNFRRSRAANSAVHGWIWLDFVLQYDEDPIKNEGTRVFTTLNIDFSDAQGQVSVVGSGKNSNSSKLICMSLFPARMKKFQSKMKALECSQHLSHCRLWGIFQALKGS